MDTETNIDCNKCTQNIKYVKGKIFHEDIRCYFKRCKKREQSKQREPRE